MIKEGRPKIEIDLTELEEAVATCKNDGEVAEWFGVGRNLIYDRKANDDLFRAAYVRGKAKRYQNIHSRKSANHAVTVVLSGAEYEIFEKEAIRNHKTVSAFIKENVVVAARLAEKNQITRKDYELLKQILESARDGYRKHLAACDAFVALFKPERFNLNRDLMEESAWEFSYYDQDFDEWFAGCEIEVIDDK